MNADPLSGATFRHDVMTRRNVLFGLRMARLLGLPVPEREPYAWRVHLADLKDLGDEGMLDKVFEDSVTRGIALTRTDLQRYLREAEVHAHLDLVAQRRRRSARERTQPPLRIG